MFFSEVAPIPEAQAVKLTFQFLGASVVLFPLSSAGIWGANG